MKGGLEINPIASTGSPNWCTAGYVVRDTNGYYKMLTAGHCIQISGGYDQPWYHTADRYGHGRYETWGNGVTRDADVGLTTISDDEIPTIKNQIYVGNQSVRNITGTRGLWEYPEGAAVQRYGTNRGHDPGTIFLRNVTRPSCVPGYGCMTVRKSVEVDFDSKGGDSGGPVFAVAPSGGVNRIALGTHVHSDPDEAANPHGWYSPQDVGRAVYESVTPGAPYEICSGILSPCP